VNDFAAQPYGYLGGLVPGSRVAEYVIEEQIGAGGMAAVFRARDEVLGRLAAVKVLSRTMASDEEFRVRFLRESRAVAAVDHPHIIPVYAAGETDKVLYIATRFILGGDLAMLLGRAGGVLSPERAVALVSQVASALDAAHAAGLVHRDVKPGNILVDAIPGWPEHAYLSDFGLSKGALSATGLTATGQFLGTPDYCSPEQIRGAAVDGRADQYALACVAFVLLTGALPFRRKETMATLFAHINDPAPSLAALRPALPAAVDAVAARGLAKSPADRYERCGEFAAALRDALAPIGQAPADGGWPGYSDNGPPQLAQPTYASLLPSGLAPPTVTASSMPVRQESMPHPNTAIRGSAARDGSAPGGWAAPGIARQAGPSRRRRRRTAVLAGSAAAVLAAAGVTAALALPGSHGSHGTRTAGTRGSALPPLRIGTPALATTLAVPGGGTVNSVQFSPDGKFLAAAERVTTGTPKIYVWDTAKRTYLTTLTMPSTYLQYEFSFSFSEDDSTLSGTFLNIPTSTYTIYRWNLSTGDLTKISSFPESGYWGLSGDYSTLAVADSSGKQISVQHVGTGVVFAHLTMLGNSAIASYGSLGFNLSLDSDGGRLVVGYTNGTAYVWDVAKQKIIATLHYNHNKNTVQLPVLSPDGNTVAVYGSGNEPPTLWDVATQSNVTPHDSRWLRDNAACVFSMDSRVCGTDDRASRQTVDLWDVGTHAYLLTVTDPNDVNDGGIGAIGPDDSEVAILGSVGSSKQIYLWDIPRDTAKS